MALKIIFVHYAKCIVVLQENKKGVDGWIHNGVQEKGNRMNYNMLRS